MNGALTLDVAAEQAEALLHVVDVIRADRKFAVGDFVKLSGGDDHDLKLKPKSEFRRDRKSKSKFFQSSSGLAGKITLTSVPCDVESISTRPS